MSERRADPDIVREEMERLYETDERERVPARSPTSPTSRTGTTTRSVTANERPRGGRVRAATLAGLRAYRAVAFSSLALRSSVSRSES